MSFRPEWLRMKGQFVAPHSEISRRGNVLSLASGDREDDRGLRERHSWDFLLHENAHGHLGCAHRINLHGRLHWRKRHLFQVKQILQGLILALDKQLTLFSPRIKKSFRLF